MRHYNPAQKYFLILVLVSLFLPDQMQAQNKTRAITELTAYTSGWEVVLQLVRHAKNNVEILPAKPDQAKEALFQTQVTTHSTMGALIYFSGGLLVDHGWIRILGSGNTRLNRSLPAWNKGKTFREFGERPGYLLVADDVAGGFFAINGGALGADAGNVYYFAPDGLQWEALHFGYADFISFCCSGNLKKFYEGTRWKNWEKDLTPISGEQAFFFYPFLWTVEGKDVEKVTRKIVPVQEVYKLEMDMLKHFSK
jgi:hypothetical protein